MLVIVEGVDGVGKSTFVEQLTHLITSIEHHDDVEKLKAGPPDPELDILEEYELAIQGYRPGQHTHVVCDRWHVGELIYGPILRGTSRLDLARLTHLEMFLRSRGALVVHLTAPPLEIIERRKRRGEMDLLADDQVELVLHEYMDVLWDTATRTRIGYWGQNTQEDVKLLREMMSYAWDLDLAARPLEEFPTYIGPPKPEYLLLGEQRNTRPDDRWEAAFVPVPTGNSGHYLLSNLPPELRVKAGIANALEEDLTGLLAALDYPNVVALGKEAHNAVSEISWKHGTVPHPQYWRRFYHDHKVVYRRILREAALFGEDLLSWRP